MRSEYLKIVFVFEESSLFGNEMVSVGFLKAYCTEGKAFAVRFFLVLDARAAVAAAEASQIV